MILSGKRIVELEKLDFQTKYLKVWPGDKDGILGQTPLYPSAAPEGSSSSRGLEGETDTRLWLSPDWVDTMIPLQVFISGLILLLPGAVDSYVVVKGVVGHPVTLPCTYSTYHGVTTMCWGRGQCPYSRCQNTLIWTDGHRVTYRTSTRYKLKGRILEGDVSLTIENSVESDSGLYCCRVEIPGWFNDQKVTFSLQVKPVNSHQSSKKTHDYETHNYKKTHNYFNKIHTCANINQSLHLYSSNTSTHTNSQNREPTTFCPRETTAEMTEPLSYTPADWNGTVTSPEDAWNNHTEAIPPWKPRQNLTKGFYLGIAIAALLLMLLVSTMVITTLVAFHVSKIGALQNAVGVHPRAEDNIYIIEDRP
ncbi:Hepatitis A virus cellular receptor 1 homolog [Apodemus speciosus]|uniref:Hepatitis A virus cellular receptor 1 homolog n=1 Tax=Apodemus speciosus TaxID=105296 RepID=A0ABQ0F9N6_APOSI